MVTWSGQAGTFPKKSLAAIWKVGVREPDGRRDFTVVRGGMGVAGRGNNGGIWRRRGTCGVLGDPWVLVRD